MIALSRSQPVLSSSADTRGGEPPAAVRAAIRDLTKTQRMYVKDGCAHGDISVTTLRALIRKGLFEIQVSSPNGQWGFARLTPLGEAVSATLPISAASTYMRPALEARAALQSTGGEHG